MIPVRCPNPNCTARFDVPDHFAGMTVKCRECKAQFKIAARPVGVPPPPPNKAVPAAPVGKPPPTAPEPFVAVNPARPVAPPVAPTWVEASAAVPEPSPAPTSAEHFPAPDDPFDEDIDAAPMATISEDIPPRRMPPIVLVGLACAGGVACLLLLVSLIVFLFRPRSEVYAGYDIGSNEVKLYVFRVSTHSAGGCDFEWLNPEKPLKEDAPVQVGPNGEFDPDYVTRVSSWIAKKKRSVHSEYGVSDSNFVVLGGPGITDALRKKVAGMKFAVGSPEQTVAASQNTLSEAIAKESGLKIQFVDETRELELQIAALILESEKKDSVVLDLGSSACRGGYLDGQSGKTMTFKSLGVKECTETISTIARNKYGWNGGNANFDRDIFSKASKENIKFVFEQQFIKDLEQSKGGKVEFLGRKRINIYGGVPYVVATWANPADRDATRRRLTVANFDEFHKQFRDARNFPKLKLPDSLGEPTRGHVTEDYDQIQRNNGLSAERMIVGTDMLKVISDQLRFGDADRKVYFHNRGIHSAVLGLMQEHWFNHGGR